MASGKQKGDAIGNVKIHANGQFDSNPDVPIESES
jgi:hypothetical protein